MAIKDVADLAGVSAASVSRYLNGGPLSEEKRERIRLAIEQTGYRPSAAGKMLRTGKVNQIGVIVPRINSEAVWQVTAGIADRLRDTPYIMVLGITDEDPEKELAYLQNMQDDRVAGIILMGTSFTPEHAEVFSSCKLPLVVTGQRFAGIHCVYHDDFGAAKQLTKDMLSHGHTHIGFIGVSEDDIAVGRERKRGVIAALRESGIDTPLVQVIGAFTAENGMTGAKKLLEMDPEIDGIICATDHIALGAMSYLKEQNKDVPKDIALAGFGDNWVGTIVSPQLTSVRLYHHQCGTEAADMMISFLDGAPEVPVRQTRLGYTIVERDTL